MRNVIAVDCPKCGKHCGSPQGLASHGRAKPIEERFWAKVDQRGPDECWEWIAGKQTKGYGQFFISKKRPTGAHRFSWMLHFGPIPDGLFVCHRCDNPPCVNPAHLFLGTNLDNIADMHAKGRASGGSLSRPGEAHPEAKVTDEIVREIRRRVEEGETIRGVARDVGLSSAQAGRIVRRKAWSHVS